ncbi:MAG TPA: hypothetical protein VHY32_03870 [Caulobacteraceae bacterium]|jgi:hypothetical protein|nr:hypothetical protein [Caulobacteraceae bacterium]
MRIGVLLASLALLAAPVVASGAAATDAALKPARMKAPIDLRGSVAPDPLAPLDKPAPKALATPISALAAPTTPSPTFGSPFVSGSLASPIATAKPGEGQCRTACAHAYYFCLSGGTSTDCPDTWGQCLSGCSYPRPAIDH